MFDILEDLDNALEGSQNPVVDLSDSSVSSESLPSDTEDLITFSNGVVISEDNSLLEFNDPVTVNEPSLYALDGVYNGDIHSSARDYFEGVISQNPGVPYVSFRSGQYTSILYFGEGISYDGGRFTGSGNYIQYNSQYGASSPITRGVSSVSIGDDGYIYSNLDNSFAAFPAGEVSNHASVLSLALCVCIGLWIVGRIFFRSR